MKSSPRTSLATRVACLALSLSLIASLCAPLAPRAEATVTVPGLVSPLARAAATLASHQPASRAGEVIMRFRQGTTESEKDAIVGSHGGRRGRRLRGGSSVEKIELPSGLTPEAAAADLRSQSEVEFVEPNFIVRGEQAGVNDTRFSEQWALSNAGQSGGQPGSDINAQSAWAQTTGSTGTVIAVVDSGIDFTHPDLKNNEWTNARERANGRDDDNDGFADDLHGWDWVAESNQIADQSGHGTAVAGIIAAEGNNNLGVSGVMWRASLMSLRVLDNTGTGDVASAVEAIDYAVAHGAQVVNLSWGTDGESLALKDGITRANAAGVLVVCSAGNGGRSVDGTPYYPASYNLPNLVSVAATGNSDLMAAWSNWGAQSVAVAAPGSDILTTRIGGDYATVSGTSASAPLVSGVAGLVKTARPDLGGAAIKSVIIDGARKVAGLSGVVASGGVASAQGALAAAGTLPLGGGGNGNGQGNGSGNGQGNGESNGQGNGHVPMARPAPAEHGRGGRGPNGSFDVAPSQATKQAPPGFGNQDEIRRRRPVDPKPQTPIHADTVLPVCDASCGGDDTSAGGADPYFATARARPANRTGVASPTSVVGAGEDPGSMNVNWGIPLVQLSGRAGLDLGIGLYYNSLVWTKQASSVQFNADHGFPGPGFHLGFPTLQPASYNYDGGTYSYLMITPSGGRVEMRQTGTAGTYESADGSYTQLTENGDGTKTVRTTDGTQLLFSYFSAIGEYRCAQIKDRNGNYITVNYDPNTPEGPLGRPTSVVDTLGRVITFSYSLDNYATDNSHYLRSIKQSWRRETAAGVVTETHVWASFEYVALNVTTNFPGIYVYGPGTAAVPFLSKVNLADGTAYVFDYNPYGQVYRIRHVAPNGHTLAQTTYNLPTDTSAAQSDCPRFSQRRDWAEYWNNDNGDQVVAPSEEAVTDYSVTQNASWTMPDGTTRTGTMTQVSSPVYTDKDGTRRRVVMKDYAKATGWDAGLPSRSDTLDRNEDASTEMLVRWATTDWTQDDTALGYTQNPRVTETNVYDAGGNRRRTLYTYHGADQFTLPYEVREYAADAVTPLRSTFTDYDLNPNLISRRIIGLRSAVHVFDHAIGWYVSKTTYHYDLGGEYLQATPQQAVQHLSASNNSDPTGRGNLVSVVRFDVNDINNEAKSIEVSRAGYYSTGMVAFTRDALSHQTTISYADSFSDGAGRNTFAYPTTVTDPDNYASTAQYNYDLGGVYRAVDPKGAAAHTFYDTAGRVERMVNEVNGAYQRYDHDMDYGYNRTWASVEAGQAEAYSNAVVDGAGRARGAVEANPNSSGGYILTQTVVDALGRVVAQTNPTEIDTYSNPAGDDAAGFRWTHQAYDWKGRPTLTTYPQVTGQATSNTTEMIYGGCGCAGGEVTTARDERGRQRRLTADVLGRLHQVDELNWDGSTYATTVYAYNTRDQITQINQAGQTRSTDYDGYGRLWHRTTPEQGTTAYSYNPDDTVQSMTDARGAVQSFVYNARHLPTNINYTAAGGAAATPNVSFGYDAAGNRSSMTDGLGSVDYTYDTLSRLTQEKRSFTGVGTFSLSYDYNLAGELKRMTNPWGVQVAYVYDTQGRVTDVKGTDSNDVATYAGVSTYAQTLRHRAFGGLKSMAYGNGRTLSLSYDERLRLKQWDVPGVLGWNYRYDSFGENSQRVTYAENADSNGATHLDGNGNTVGGDPSLNRSYDYDQVGRLLVSHTGNYADGHAGLTAWPTGTPTGPYAHQYGYDQWGNMTLRVGWGGVQGGYTNATQTFSNNRQQTNPWSGATLQYDAAGNLTYDGQTYAFDATGQQVSATGGAANVSMAYDGDRLRGSKTDGGVQTYYLRSSVLGGQVVAEMNSSGGWARGYVYLGSQLLAVQSNGVTWTHADPVTKSQRGTDASGNVVATATVDVDPWGGETGRSNSAFQPKKFTSYERDGNGGDEAMMRRYQGYWMRFSQPDPWVGSYDLKNPQSLNRYTYANNDPVNLIDPTGLMCWDVYRVSWTVDVSTGKRTGPDQWHYLYTYCEDNPSLHFVRTDFQRGPGGGRDPRQQNPLAPKVGQNAAAQWKQIYNDCMEGAMAGINTERSNFANDVVMNAHKAGVQSALWMALIGYKWGGKISDTIGGLRVLGLAAEEVGSGLQGAVALAAMSYVTSFVFAMSYGFTAGKVEFDQKMAIKEAEAKKHCGDYATEQVNANRGAG